MPAGRRSDLPGLEKVLIALFASPIVGFIIGYLVLRLIYILSWNATPAINSVFKKGQLVTALALALSHGSNDAQKTMGIITLALITGGWLSSFEVPLWVILMCAGMIALGTAVGGWKLIRTLGGKFFKIRPVDGIASQFASAAVIMSASLFGGPVSTTQVVSSADHGRGRGGAAQQGALGSGRGDRHGLAAHHPGYSVGRRRMLLADHTVCTGIK